MSNAARKTNQEFVNSPLTAVSKKTLQEANNERRLIRAGNTAFRKMLARHCSALIVLVEIENKGRDK